MKSVSVAVLLVATALVAGAAPVKVDVSWDKVKGPWKTTATLQVVVNPPLRPGSPIHDRAFAELKRLGADYVRYVPWLPYPRLGVAELEPPTKEKTSWDFSLIDPTTVAFLNATKGHSVMLNFSTIPAWMFKTPKPVSYPDNPDEPVWNYTQGTEPRDPSLKEIGNYFARVVGWYVNGGFTDELGKKHESGHRYRIDYWEVLNEPDFEHQTTPQQYTARYDAVVAAVRKVSPGTKFVGISVAIPGNTPDMFEYFLNHKNHKPGIPLDMISYHFYATPAADESEAVQEHTFFTQADGFLNTARYIESMRKRLSPATQTTINETGCIAADDMEQGVPGHVVKAIPESYWNLCGATYAYVFGNLAEMGIDVVGESQLLGYPTQFPSVSMLDWNTGAPNARFRVLELLKNNFLTGGKIVVSNPSPFVYTLATIQATGERKLLLVNKRDRDVDVALPGRASRVEYVDQTTKAEPPASQTVNGDAVTLHGYSVAVVTMAQEQPTESTQSSPTR